MRSRIAHRMKLRPKLKQVVIVFSFFLFAFGMGLFLYFNLANNKEAIAAVTNDYRSITSGNWSSTSTWQRYNGSSWVSATTAPSSSQNVITIQSGHIVTITANVSVDQVVISSGGSLYLNSGVTMTVANGTGTDFTVSGTFRNTGIVTISASATIAYQSGGTYQHNYTTTAGTIPTASWATGSSCEIIGYTSNNATPSGMQSFYNFTWNCPSQSSVINLGGALTTISGDFTMASTGTGELQLASNGSTFNIGKNYIQTGGSFILSDGSGQTSTMNVSSDFSISGGTFSVMNGSNSTGNINLSGNYSHTGGTLTHGGNSSTVVLIAFTKSGTQTFTSPSTSVLLNVDYIVKSGSTLDMGTEFCSGRNFTLSSGGGLILASPTGITSSGGSGNIQVSGTRTFDTGAEYTYNGSVAQVTGDALPSTVYRLTINNSSGLTMTNSVAVSNKLTFTNGRILTGDKELNVTSTSGTSIAGQSNSSYVVGNLRRAVSSSGTYAFPLGTNSYYELLTITLSGTSGFSSLLGNFENTDPLVPAIPLYGLQANYIVLDKILNYGYWNLVPNSALSGGTYSVTLLEQGYSNPVSSNSIFSVITRLNAASSWEAPGNHSNASPALSGGVVTAIRSGLNTFNHFGIAYGQYLAFENPTLIAGNAGKVGAVYVFPNVCINIDAWMEIMELDGGATLSSIDNSSTGYSEAFQPFVDMAPNTTSSIRWKITFKIANTSLDTTIASMSMTGVDVDGGSTIREFIEATMPYSYSLDSATTLTVTNVSGNYRAVSGYSTISNIDTSHHEAMYQLNYRNINTLYYRTGGISTSNSIQTRQTSLYFRAFLSGSVALPIKLIYFNASLKDKQVELNWATASEINNDYFSVERSSDSKTFETVASKQGAGNSTVTRYYSSMDREPLGGYSYYRLKQTDYDGKYTYSQIVAVKNGSAKSNTEIDIQSISPNPFDDKFTVDFAMKQSSVVNFMLLNGAGMVLSQEKIEGHEGNNSYQYESRGSLVPGIYFAVFTVDDKKIVRKILKR